jgi:hypothetical protein
MESQSRSGHFGREKKKSTLPGIECTDWAIDTVKKKSHTSRTGARIPAVPRTEGQSPLETSVQVGEHLSAAAWCVISEDVNRLILQQMAAEFLGTRSSFLDLVVRGGACSVPGQSMWDLYDSRNGRLSHYQLQFLQISSLLTKTRVISSYEFNEITACGNSDLTKIWLSNNKLFTVEKGRNCYNPNILLRDFWCKQDQFGVWGSVVVKALHY